AVADELQLEAARGGLARDSVRNLPRAERKSAGIAGHIYSESHAGAVTSYGRLPKAARRAAPESPCHAAVHRSSPPASRRSYPSSRRARARSARPGWSDGSLLPAVAGRARPAP